jgi:adenine-specific DNA-methyltransferase
MADTPEGQRREAQPTRVAAFGSTEGDIRKGFVYERVPRVTLKSINENEVVVFVAIEKTQLRVSPARARALAARTPSASGVCWA